MAARQEEEFDRADAEAFRRSPQNQQRADFLAFLSQDQAVRALFGALVDERIDARIDELRSAFESAAITRARQLMRREQTENAEAEAPATTTTR